eukprot:scaffold182696_cov20-Prasinocladus_malaysianus.AAC.2
MYSSIICNDKSAHMLCYTDGRPNGLPSLWTFMDKDNNQPNPAQYTQRGVKSKLYRETRYTPNIEQRHQGKSGTCATAASGSVGS